MAKWKCEICGNEFDNFHAQGFDNRIYCPLCYFKKENQELKSQLKGTTHCFDEEEHEKLKKQLEENKDKINWYENFEINKTIDKLRIKHNNQQKEFIKYLEDEIKRLKENDIYQPLQKMALATHEHILQKYKSIIGVSDDKTN